MVIPLLTIFNSSDIKPISEPRGFPDDATFAIIEKYMMRVVSDNIYNEYCYNDNQFIISESKYNNLVKHYNIKTTVIDNRKYIVCPDYHSDSWCTTNEMESAINEIIKTNIEDNNAYAGEWFALLGTMKGYEQNGEYECRAIFWFDN